MSSEFTKWEQKSTKGSVLYPLLFLIGILVVSIVLAAMPNAPMEAPKKDASSQTEAGGAAPEEQIDWNSF